MRTLSKQPKVVELFKSLETVFKKKKRYFDLFVDNSFKPEDWIKTEIVAFWHQKSGVAFAGISHAIDRVEGEPDLALNDKRTKPVTIELKVLPTDRNYKTARQRFHANKHNKIDFQRLSMGQRDFLIYVFWKDTNDWEKQRQYLRGRYRNVALAYQFDFAIKKGRVVFSLWKHSR